MRMQTEHAGDDEKQKIKFYWHARYWRNILSEADGRWIIREHLHIKLIQTCACKTL